MDEGVVRSEKDHFVEKAEFLSALEVVCASAINSHGIPASPKASQVTESFDRREKPEEIECEKAIHILEKYQEQSHLLDKHLEEIVGILMDSAKTVLALREKDRIKGSPPSESSQEIHSFPFQVYRNDGLQLVLKVLYTLCKVRGYKSVRKNLPHEVAELEPVLWLLECQDAKDYETWETRYSLLLWMSMLVLIPFDLENVDSSLAKSEQAGEIAGGSLVKTVIDMCKHYLTDSGPCREVAAICLARLLTRPDMESFHLEQFLEWSAVTLEAIARRQDTNETISTDTFLVTGVFQALTEVFKYGHREKLVAHIPVIFSRVLAVTNRDGQHSLQRKLTMKLVQRTGLNFLPPKVVSWRYQRGKRSLLQNLSKSMDVSQQLAQVEGSGETGVNDEDVDVPEEVEDVIEKLLCGLRDRDTIVRWSAAKGIGRITSRLPLELADDVVAFVLELFDASEGDSAWHGGCLALAELARRGLLLPDRLDKVVPFVVDALVYDVRKGHNSVGANVRDAACYVCWAFARAYDPAVMAPHVTKLAQQMLVTAVFDREVNCRRAASAAFQENVGRQGHDNFPHGIEILTAADYFTLGVRSNAYLKISSFIAQFETYRKPLIDHLVERKLVHWDLNLRVLSAETLHVLCERDPAYMANTVLPSLLPKTLSPDMLVRHGATMGVSQIVTALAKVPYQLDKEALADVRNTVMRIEKARLYRGRGGEWMRVAACNLIEAIAQAGHPLSLRAQKRLLESIEESMKHPKEEVKDAAIKALHALCHEYFGTDPNVDDGGDFLLGDAPTGPCPDVVTVVDVDQLNRLRMPNLPQCMPPTRPEIVARIVDSYCEKLENIDPNAAVRRGCALALGVLPARIVAASEETLAKVLNVLIKATKLEDDADLRDAETRRNAVISLGNLVETVGLTIPGLESEEKKLVQTSTLSKEQMSMVFEALFNACEDYETDNRGDVGSWVRTVAIQSLMKVVRTIRAFPGTLLTLSRSETSSIFVSKNLGNCNVLRYLGIGSQKFGAWVQVPEKDPPNVIRKIILEKEAQASGEEDGFFLPDQNERVATYVENAGEKALASVLNQKPLEGYDMGKNVASVLKDFLPVQVTTRVMNCVIKQLCEKIGTLREAAGAVLEQLLKEAEDPVLGLPFVAPHLHTLKDIFLSDHTEWKMESAAFPKVVRVVAFQEYIDAALGGLVLSIGDLTESVSKNASDALLHWCKEKKGQSSFPELHGVADALLRMLESNQRCDRVVVPTLKTLDMVLESQVLMFGRSPRLEWLLRVHDACKAEMRNCANVAKLVSCSKVFFHLASFKPPVRTLALTSVLILLGHKYPRVRMTCAKDFNLWALAMDGTEVCGESVSGDGEATADSSATATTKEGKDDEAGDFLDFMREQAKRYEEELSSRPDCQRPPLVPGFDPDAAFEEAQDVVAEVSWDAISTKQARAQRDKLYDLLRISKPETKAKTPLDPEEEVKRQEQQQQQLREEEDSYATLVHSAEMGYK